MTARCGAVFDGDDVHVEIEWGRRCQGAGEKEGESERKEGRKTADLHFGELEIM